MVSPLKATQQGCRLHRRSAAPLTSGGARAGPRAPGALPPRPRGIPPKAANVDAGRTGGPQGRESAQSSGEIKPAPSLRQVLIMA